MDVTFDRHLFTQIGLDSGALTMLGSVVHGFSEPGEYRCTVHAGPAVKAVFVIHADPDSANAQATVDLEALVSGPAPSTGGGEGCGCGDQAGAVDAAVPRFEVNPRGHVLFRVGRGPGHYYVHARRTSADKDDKGYDTRAPAVGDAFAAVVLRPGAYAVQNAVTGAKGELVVTYPDLKERRYRPEGPVRVRCDAKGFTPSSVRIGPGQGLVFEVHAPSRVSIALTKADDGPADRTRVRPPRKFVNLAAERRARG